MIRSPSTVSVGLLWRVVMAALVSSSNARAQQPPEAIYVGAIVTMNAAQPVAEAIAVAGGRIVAVGQLTDVMKHRREGTRIVRLGSGALLPGFIDAHSHVTGVAERLAQVDLSPPPVGSVTSIADLQRRLREALPGALRRGDRWLVAGGYDHTRLAERRTITREDLDAVSTTVPIVVNHFSGHIRVVNSKGLTEAGITADTPDPPGGRIRRTGQAGEPTGELEETAQAFIDARLEAARDSARDARRAEEFLASALEKYAAAGYTTVTEAWATGERLALLSRMSKAGRLPLDVVALPHYTDAPASALDGYSTRYSGRLRIGGVKINLDGGSPGRTAFLRQPYYRQQPKEIDYRGYPRFDVQEALSELIARYYRMAVPVHIHALGDAAVDQAITAVVFAEREVPGRDRRTQLIHLQQVQEDQLDALKRLQVTLSFQIAHVFYFGELHRAEIFGPERAARLTPLRSAIDRGFSVSIHMDAPVHPIDQLALVWIAANRLTAGGNVLGATQRASVVEALQASTIGPAFQLFEESEKGSLEVGKVADFVILDRSPLTEPRGSLRSVRVVETIKGGITVYRAPSRP